MRVLHRLENLTGVGFCCLCYALGNNCGCSRAMYQAPHGYGSTALWTPPKPSYASMVSSTMTTASTSMRGVSPTMGPPPGFPAMGAPTLMDVSPSYNPLAHAGVGRGLRPQSVPGSARPWVPGTVGLCQAQPSAPVNWLLPREVKRHIQPSHTSSGTPISAGEFASPVTKAEATTSQSQSVAKRGRPQTREQGGHQEQASHSRTRKDRSST